MTTLNILKMFFFQIYVFLKHFLYFLQTLQHVSTYLDSVEDILILFCNSSHIHYEKINLYTLINV